MKMIENVTITIYLDKQKFFVLLFLIVYNIFKFVQSLYEKVGFSRDTKPFFPK